MYIVLLVKLLKLISL